MDLISAMRVYVRVVDLQSFSLAASDLGISSSSVSKQVSHLEQHVGATLLQRTTRTLEITSAGKAYHERCRIILAEVEQSERLAGELSGSPSGTVQLQCDGIFSRHLLMPLLTGFSKIHPEICFEITQTQYRDEPEEYDLHISINNLEDKTRVTLGQVTRLLCASSDYLQSEGIPQTVAELERHNCLICTGQSWAFDCPEQGGSLSISGDLKSSDSDLIRQGVLAGRGIACLPAFQVSDDVQSGRLKVVLPEVIVAPLFIQAEYSAKRYQLPKSEVFVDYMLENIQSLL